MNGLPLHPALVHLPLGVAFVAPLVAGYLCLAWWRSGRRPDWRIAVGLQAVVFVGAFAAMQAGEADEERVENGVPEEAIHEHEELGEAFVTLSGIVLGLGLIPLFVRRERLALGLAAASVAGGLGVAGLGVATGEAGGELVWLHDAPATLGASGGAALPDDDDDD